VWLQTGYELDWHTCTYHSEPQVITPLSRISTLYKLPQHPLSPFPAWCVFNNRSLEMAPNTGDSSASRAHVVTVRRIYRNWTLADCQLNYTAISSQPPLQSSNHCLLSTNSAGLGSSLYSLGIDPTENIASNSPSSVVMSGCLVISRISFLWERVYRAAAQQRMFLLAFVAWQRYYTLQY
jgi:hypothetical protein